ncbi:hypothetical protein NDU88_003439 [Pleurodeles waltl]|uniref:Uncharacterized protein n=1 Tax=Pleurodeles waltl TaxID=8319 RepID=A0AAV7T6N0_PLEWA|nr:hypothetical protein NDU88_003439 [Pleurodeles waltl]
MAQQSALHETQFTDIQWKKEDFENRQCRNKLRILGIQEGAEGQEPRAFIVKIFRAAFPDLVGWDWEKEVQRVYRFPLYLKKQQMAEEATVNHPHPRAIIVYFGNSLLRKAVFEKACLIQKLTARVLLFLLALISVIAQWKDVGV